MLGAGSSRRSPYAYVLLLSFLSVYKPLRRCATLSSVRLEFFSHHHTYLSRKLVYAFIKAVCEVSEKESVCECDK